MIQFVKSLLNHFVGAAPRSEASGIQYFVKSLINNFHLHNSIYKITAQ